MIFCAFRFSDALFQPCYVLLYIHWGIIGVSLVFWHFGSCLRHTQTTWLRWLKPRPVSKWHFVMPTCHPFSARPTLTRPPHGPAKGKSYKPNHLHFCPFHWGLHQRSSPPILQTSSAAHTPMLLRRMSCSALTGVILMLAAIFGCLSRSTLIAQHSPHSCYVLFFGWCSCMWSPWLWGWRVNPNTQSEGLKDLSMSPAPMK